MKSSKLMRLTSKSFEVDYINRAGKEGIRLTSKILEVVT